MADIFGTDGNDILTGTTEPDIINGGEGNDNIDGNLGSDIIDGGPGNDSILGAPGSDTLIGGAGNDTVIGGNSNDIINGSSAEAAGYGEVDILTGSANNDTFILGDATQAYYTGSGNNDYARITDFTIPSPGAAIVDTIQLKGIPSDYSLVQSGGDVNLLYNGELIAILANQSATALDLNANYFSYVGSGVTLVGTSDDDVLNGGVGFDTLSGDAGNDILNGGDGRDTLSGDVGNDTVNGEGGNDTILGGDGNDLINGGDGNDTVDAGLNDDVVNGGAGNDNINGAPGFDTISGGAGNDTVNGGGQDDVLSGTDSAVAGAGEVDTVSGGSGNDRFILGDETKAYYSTGGNADYVRITDFAETGEVIQLHGAAADYSLTQAGADVEIRYNGELIGILANRTATAFDLNGPAFAYVMAVNTPPTAVDDVVTTDEDSPLTIAIADLLNNDVDPDTNATLSLVSIDTTGSNGTITQVGDTLVYTPANTLNSLGAGETAVDSFSYTMTDGSGAESTATVHLTINGVNDAPIAQAEAFTIDEDNTLTIAIADLLSNDSDIDANDTLTLTGVSNSVNGSVSLDGAGNVVFTPDADFFGDASFDYTISDGQGRETTATVAVTVNPVADNTDPTTSGIDSFKVTDNAPNTVIDLFAAFDDAEDADAALTYTLVVNTNASLFTSTTLDSTAGTLTLDYASGANGSADLTLRATDTVGSFVETTFTVSVFDATIFGDYIEGTNGEDVFLGNSGNDTLLGLGGNDWLKGNLGRDTIYGGEGQDDLVGGDGSDFLSGDTGDDILDGTGLLRGFFEQDVLAGGLGSDTFVLGDQSSAYYTGGFLFDYVSIKDFNSQEDTLQLHGSAKDYRISQQGSLTYLYKTQKLFGFSFQDLVAVVQGNPVDLNSSAMNFVS